MSSSEHYDWESDYEWVDSIIASFLFAACSASYIGSPLSRTTLVGPSGVISTGDYGYGVPLGLSKTIVAGPTLLGKSLVGPTLLGKSLVGPTLLDRTLLTRSVVGPSVIGSKLIAGPGLIGGYGAPLGLSKTIGYGSPLVSGYGLAGPTLLAGPAIRACIKASFAAPHTSVDIFVPQRQQFRFFHHFTCVESINMQPLLLLTLCLVAAVAADNPYAPRPSYSPRPSYQPAPAYNDHPQYKYEWAVKDDYSGTYYAAAEYTASRDGYNTQGNYRTLLPDGRVRTVTYTVQGDAGYVADVQYAGEPRYDTYKPAPAYKPAPSYKQPVYAPAPRYGH
ncbi:unnamed protein product [Cyprideis torosa]|uniref:Uncharacterized protein n=1 Tax=Cyprideis torosa TaxID=163714 RepID=A0A7R8WFA5_9CRUS|nr:unnamed protein product [Cyprideis torosa]CAG0891245.1 unnamed protein product [Cyprideis torosa]